MKRNRMTPRERVMTALRGGCPDKTPFAVYENKIPQCSVERRLRNQGLCIVQRTSSFQIQYPDVGIKEYRFRDEIGRNLVQKVFSTPFGDLTTLDEPVDFTVWHHKKLFQSKEDYKSILYLVRNARVVPCYDAAARLSKMKGDDFLIRDELPYEPMQKIILDFMGIETFCYEWMDNRDEILELNQALIELHRKIYPVVADGPLEIINYGGNVIPEIIGADNFEKYFLPVYNEAAEVFHRKGKLFGNHFDADNSLIMDAIGKTGFDYIEAFDPGCGPSVREARKAWPGKTLWINWPSSLQHSSPDEIHKITVEMIEQAAPGNGFIIGITETVPEELWQRNFSAIMYGIDLIEW